MDVVESPCVRICVVEDEICQGCGRTLDEIADWRIMTNEQKRAVWQRLEKSSNNINKKASQ